MSDHIDGPPAAGGGSVAGNRPGAKLAGGFAAWLYRLARCDRGMAAVEFGLAVPILLAALIPVADLGIAFSREHQLRQAVQAGAQYAANQPSWDAGAIAGAVTGATSLSGVTVSPAPYQMCGCPTVAGASGNAMTTGGLVPVACGSTCGQEQTAGRYAVVSAQVSYTPILPYSLLGSSTTLTAQSVVRIG